MNASAEPCVDCRERDARLEIRNRRLCDACFIRYVTSKILKRMESYRFKNLAGHQKRRLFLPISGGVSSLVLLQVLDTQLQRQIGNRNRTAYDLIVARVVFPDTADLATVEVVYQKLAQRFPLHTFLPLIPLHDVFVLDQKIERDLDHLGINRHATESHETLLGRIFSSATSMTTRAGLQSIFLQRLLASIAKQESCEGVLWGHSDSRLAALALADVAKGRGGSVPSIIADGPSMHGLNFNYPARDLFKVELQIYASALSHPLVYETEGGIADRPASTIRNTSIGDLLSSYINSQGEKYPSIMANVVRTAGKLQVKNTEKGVVACSICVMPIPRAFKSSDENLTICYGCQRMKQDIKTN